MPLVLLVDPLSPQPAGQAGIMEKILSVPPQGAQQLVEALVGPDSSGRGVTGIAAHDRVLRAAGPEVVDLKQVL
jgi:hypothetical protein